MPLPPIVALEIGTSKVVALVGEMREDGHVMITGIGEHQSAGVRKGEIVDIEHAMVCVRSALGMAEESGKVAIRQVHLAVSGGHIQSVTNRGSVPVRSAEGEITTADADQVLEVARAINLPPDRDVLHTLCQYYCIDDQERVIRPEGMEGAKLAVDVLVLHGVRRRVNNTLKVVRNLLLDVQDVVFSGLCAALSTLTEEQKKMGVLIMDIGGGTVSYAAYSGGVVAAAGCLGLGGDHITNDVAIGLSIPTARAEQLKRDAGAAKAGSEDGFQKVSVAAEVGFSGREVSVRTLNTIIEARVDEILRQIRRRVEPGINLHQIGAGVVLTGGGARLRRIDEAAEEVFGLPCTIGKPRNVTGLAAVTEGPEYAVASGLVQYGFKTMGEDGQEMQFSGWLRKLFGR
jgi:cell division protein FtsA